jgi:hypothetical protein
MLTIPDHKGNADQKQKDCTSLLLEFLSSRKPTSRHQQADSDTGLLEASQASPWHSCIIKINLDRFLKVKIHQTIKREAGGSKMATRVWKQIA